MTKRIGMLLHSQVGLRANEAISYGKKQDEKPKQNEKAVVNSKKMPMLSGNSMIARIHNVRPGCGSCGK